MSALPSEAPLFPLVVSRLFPSARGPSKPGRRLDSGRFRGRGRGRPHARGAAGFARPGPAAPAHVHDACRRGPPLAPAARRLAAVSARRAVLRPPLLRRDCTAPPGPRRDRALARGARRGTATRRPDPRRERAAVGAVRATISANRAPVRQVLGRADARPGTHEGRRFPLRGDRSPLLADRGRRRPQVRPRSRARAAFRRAPAPPRGRASDPRGRLDRRERDPARSRGATEAREERAPGVFSFSRPGSRKRSTRRNAAPGRTG